MVQTFSTAEELARGAAERFVAVSQAAVDQRGFFTVALSGGSTPKTLYELLADRNEGFRVRVPWSKTHFFWSDERHVGPDHPDNNYRMAHEAMLSRVPVDEKNVHRVLSENPNAQEAADDYERRLRRVVNQDLPQIDLILLGLGPDGHTASLFPVTDVLHEMRRLVAAPWVEKLQTYRITMTVPLLNNGGCVMFLVSGSEKAQILREVLDGPQKYPAQLIKPTHGQLLWLTDQIRP